MLQYPCGTGSSAHGTPKVTRAVVTCDKDKVITT